MRYQETVLSPSASHSIEAIWSARAEGHDASLVLPDGRSDLILRRSADGAKMLRLTRPSSVAHHVPAPPGTNWVGYRLRPGAARRLWDRFGETEDVSGEGLLLALPELRTSDHGRVLDRLAAPRPATLINALATIHSAFGDIRVSAIASECGVTVRTLSRLFQDWVGMSPKSYAQIIRFRRALCLLGTESASDIAYLTGYADQAHMSRDFKARLGTKPSQAAGLQRPNLPH